MEWFQRILVGFLWAVFISVFVDSQTDYWVAGISGGIIVQLVLFGVSGDN